MKTVKITVMKKACYEDLIKEYENPIEHACEMSVGQVFISENAEIPENFCSSAWQNISPFVFALSHGGGDFYDGWMKNKNSAMISCNDGFRPVSFLLEAI
ncbi:MAG: TIGR04076 family protein [Clostridiales bacterium]|nr:TIGR04076 family protein [Candidatus Equinaster intestinalis]